jgi:hypothetical protein
MDQQLFDHLARGLASGITRRGLVGNLTGTAIGGVLVAIGASEAGARKRRKRRGGKRKRPRNQCTACSAECPGAPESNPGKTLTFTPTGDEAFCGVTVNLTGYAGCTEYTAEYWSALNFSGFRAQNRGNVTLGPTDLSGSSQSSLGTFVEGGFLDIRINGVATAWTPVEC